MKKKVKETGDGRKRKYIPPTVKKTSVINRFYLACVWDMEEPGCGAGCLSSSCP